MKLKIASLFLVLVFGCASVSGRQFAQATAAGAFDLATTQYAIRHGAVEWNPVLKRLNLSQNVVVSLIGNVLMVGFSKHLRDHGDKHWKLPVHMLVTMHVGAGIWNLYVAEGLR